MAGVKNKIVITPSFGALCDQALSLGISVKVVEITLFSSWEYGVNVKEFNKADFWIHRPRPSGWTRQMISKLKKNDRTQVRK